MADAPVMDRPDNTRDSGDRAFSDLLFADSGAGQSPVESDDSSFQLRGLEDNRLIDAATPLLGLVIRVRRLADFREVETLYRQVVDEVAAVDRVLLKSAVDVEGHGHLRGYSSEAG